VDTQLDESTVHVEYGTKQDPMKAHLVAQTGKASRKETV
jgi:hypothetical protein